MARRFVFPDPNDRSKNDPSVILSNAQVLNIYNQDSDDADAMQKVTTKVQDSTIKLAKAKGWDNAYFVGNQCILTNEQFK